MNNSINLENFNIRTDLIIDNMENISSSLDIDEVKYDNNNVSVSRINLDIDRAKLLNKDSGRYITIQFKDITNYENRECVGKVLECELMELFKNMNISDDDSCLIIGLGNDKSTPDSLGPLVINNLVVTRHLFLMSNSVKEGIRCVSAVSPGVMADTGIETANIILDIVNDIKPKFLVVIDALASSSIDRINKTIQITDTGIHPGSGIGNDRKEISFKTIGIPVIAIGVPTVVDASTIIGDTIGYLYKHISYIKNNYNKNKLIFNRNNYLDKIKDNSLNSYEKKEVSGMIGELSSDEVKELFDEVLSSVGYNMMVTVKEIDFIMEKLSSIISSSLNNSLHKEITNF